MDIDDVIKKFDMGAGVFSREEMEVALNQYLEDQREMQIRDQLIWELEQ